MTKPLTIAAAFIGTLALFYLFGAFVAWDWNAGNWPLEARANMGFFAFAFAVGSAFITGIRHD